MSAKTSNQQQGRRTPLSLSGAVTKGQANNKNGGNNSTNGHTNNSKKDNKNQQNQQQKTEQQTNVQKQQQQPADLKENPTKVQPKQNESKIPKPQVQTSETSKQQKQNQNDKKEEPQNGVTTNLQTENQQENQKQQQSVQDKQQNGNDAEIAATKDKKATQEKPEKEAKDSKNSEKPKHDKKESEIKTEDKKENDKKKDKKAATADVVETTASKATLDENKTDANVAEKMEGVEEEQPLAKQDSQKSPAATPKSVKESKTSTPTKTPTKAADKTPTKAADKTPSKVADKTPTKTAEKTPQKSNPRNREVTTAIDDVEMEPLTVLDQSPLKEKPDAVEVSLAPNATSTPGKIVLPKRNVPAAKTEIQLALQSSPERPRAFSQISGRRGIRPMTDYTPSKFENNPHFRESYRRINTELDATNTSLNVTVGSEVPNNSSFSFFGRGRKRDRTPPQLSQSAIGELQTDMDISPPKRARLDFFTVVSSPLTMLRNRFSRTSLQSSTPVKLQQKLEENEDDVEVQNVSGLSVHEDIDKPDAERANISEDDATLGVEAVAANNTPIEGELEISDNGNKELASKSELSEDGDIKITETPLQMASGDAVAKNRRCIVM